MADVATDTTTFIDRTLARLRSGWREIAASRRGISAISPRPDLPDDDVESVREQMRACLEARGGEVSARARAAALGRAYLSLDPAGRRRFLGILSADFDLDRDIVDAAVDDLTQAATVDARQRAEARLRAGLVSPRTRLLQQFNALPEGVKFLVDLRAELMELVRDDATLKGLEADLKGLLMSWFDVGFLELRRITWGASAALLEKLIAYEAVHEIRSWDDLKNRLDSDRRCYAFFHPRMPDEPLIFVEVALVTGMADNVRALLDESAPVQDAHAANTAIFYSISNAQKGLAGISFGNFLIKRVVDDLMAEFKSLKTFATLSPVPGFMRWLVQVLEAEGDEVLTAGERKALAEQPLAVGQGSLLTRALAVPDWHRNAALEVAMRTPLMRLCADYLTNSKHEHNKGRILDPVAHFHLSNGARVERLNWLGDISGNGMRQSAGLMVNYQYRLDRIESYHEAYTGESKVTVSSAVRGLLKS
jgi:malonyl-CoA decarboxylase